MSKRRSPVKVELKRKSKNEVASQEALQEKETPQVKDVLSEAEAIIDRSLVSWQPKKKLQTKNGLTACIVISDSTWYGNQKVNLEGFDTKNCEWGEYGNIKPVFIEEKGKLIPYTHSDIVGESPARTYKAANPEGFKEVFRHRSGLLEKMKIGMMVGLIIAIMVLIYVMINQKPPDEFAAMLLRGMM